MTPNGKMYKVKNAYTYLTSATTSAIVLDLFIVFVVGEKIKTTSGRESELCVR